MVIPKALKAAVFFQCKPDETLFFYNAFQMIDLYFESSLAKTFVRTLSTDFKYEVNWSQVIGLCACSYSMAIVNTYELLEEAVLNSNLIEVFKGAYKQLLSCVRRVIKHRREAQRFKRNNEKSDSSHDFAIFLWQEMLIALKWLINYY
jgi:hypothetical protein